LSYGVSPEGPTHLRSNYQGIEKNMPYEQRLSYEGKAEPMIEQEDKLALLDSFILCKFVRFGIDWELLVDTYNIIFNESINKRGLREIADNIVTMSRVFNVREGFTRDDDYMPKRAYREYLEAPDGKKTKLDWEKYDKMLDEYYELRNWDENGIPKRIKKKSKDF